MAELAAKGITLRVGSPDNIAEEAPSSYKDVTEVVNICKLVVSTGPPLTLPNWARPQHGHKQEGL